MDWPADKIERRKVDDLIPYARNARTHSDEQVAQIAASIKEWGWTTPVLVDEDGEIIAGHGRVLAARKLGIDEIPTMTATGWTKAQKQAYVLADNQLPQNADWNMDLLKIEMQDLSTEGFDLSLLGFGDDMLANMLVDETEGLTDEDAVPDVPENPVTVLGDVWLLGNHRLMCGDSTSIDAVDKLMGGVKADMVFTDPPYGMNLDTDYSKMPSTKLSGNKAYDKILGDGDDFDPATITTTLCYFEYCKEIFLWGADYYSEHIPQKNSGSWVVWDKRVDEKFDKMIGSGFELCWSKAKHKRMLARFNNTLFGGDPESKGKVHPTQKPTKLVEWFFDYYSVAGAKVVVDLFGGSGSTLIACEKTGRDCRMMELDPKYCDVIVKRWCEFTGKDATLERTGETFSVLKNGSDKNAA
jgi:DNA modification methylase